MQELINLIIFSNISIDSMIINFYFSLNNFINSNHIRLFLIKFIQFFLSALRITFQTTQLNFKSKSL